MGFYRYKSVCPCMFPCMTAVSWLIYYSFYFFVFRRKNFLIDNSNLWGFKRVEHPNFHSGARRFEPSSRTFLIGEQPNAWDLLQPRAKVSRPLSYIISHVLSRITTGADYTFVPLSSGTPACYSGNSHIFRYLHPAHVWAGIQSLRGLETNLVCHRWDDIRSDRFNQMFCLWLIAVHSISFIAIAMITG